MIAYTIYINPACSKCKQALDLITQYPTIPISIRYYLETPLTTEEATNIVHLFGEKAVRNHEGDDSESSLIKILLNDSSRLQRPLIIGGGTGCIGRPIDLLKTYLDNAI